MTLDDSILGLRLRVIRRAQAAGVSVVGREVGISRTVFYRWRKRLERYGPRRPASAPPPRPAGPAGAAGTRGRAADRERRAQCRDLGLWADCRRPGAPLDTAGGAEHRAAGVAPGGLGDASRPAHGARAPGGAHGRAVDRAHPPAALAGAPRPHAPRRDFLWFMSSDLFLTLPQLLARHRRQVVLLVVRHLALPHDEDDL